jgi:hypothetical protein
MVVAPLLFVVGELRLSEAPRFTSGARNLAGPADTVVYQQLNRSGDSLSLLSANPISVSAIPTRNSSKSLLTH